MTTEQILQTINAVSQRLNEVNTKLDLVINLFNEQNSGKIDYLAMMSDIDIPSEKEGIENE